MQQAEILELIAIHGQGNIRAIVENFKWDADSYPKLESAYKEAGKRHICRQVRHNIFSHTCVHNYRKCWALSVVHAKSNLVRLQDITGQEERQQENRIRNRARARDLHLRSNMKFQPKESVPIPNIWLPLSLMCLCLSRRSQTCTSYNL